MSVEAMKQWLEALEHGLDYAKSEQFENAQRYKGYESLAPDDAHSIQLIEAAITALRQAIEQAENQKPVAVILEDMKGGGYIEWLDDTYFVPGTKFYTQPQQAEKQEPVATLIEHLAFTDGIIRFYGVENMEQLPVGTEFYTTPQPQRQWVGLTKDEMDDCECGWYYQTCKALEAKLKEKNGGKT